MHGRLETDNGVTLMAGDTPPGTEHNPGNNIAVSLSGDDADAARGRARRQQREGCAVCVNVMLPCGERP